MNSRLRMTMNRWMFCLVATGLAGLLAVCPTHQRQTPMMAANPDLVAHSVEFEQDVIEVVDGVHVAIGFGLANAILIEGDDGVIIIYTMESVEAAIPVKKAFEAISSKPVKAIIYTHFHSDHTFGATVMAGNFG